MVTLTILSVLILIIIGFILLIAIFFSEEIKSTRERDPAAKNYIEIILLYSGLHAIISYRIANALFKAKVPILPRLISQAARFLTGIEIHPGAKIGRRFFIDHGMGVVIGETTEIGDDVVLYQGVTLGGVSLKKGKRHPTVGIGVVIGAQATILGPVVIGDGAMVGAGSVVVKDIPSGAVAVGVPAKVISRRHLGGVKISLRHDKISDPLLNVIRRLEERVYFLERKLGIGLKEDKKVAG